MTFVSVTSEFAIVVRMAALRERAVSLAALMAVMEVSEPLDRNDELLSFGPHFGGGALDEFVSRLSALGLRYLDDFFEFAGDHPKWCAFGARLVPPGAMEIGTRLANVDLEEIEMRCNRATSGPWKSYVEGREEMSGSSFIMTGAEDIYLTGATVADQDFIAHARQDIPQLIEEVRRLQGLLSQ